MTGILRQGERYFLTSQRVGPIGDSAIPDYEFTLVMFPEPVSLGRASHGTTTKGLLIYLDRLDISIGESNFTEIVDLFRLLHPWKRILESIKDFSWPVREEKKDRIQIYTPLIHPPIFEAGEDIDKIVLWTIDIWIGDLERWEMYEDNQGEKRIECEVLESSFVYTL